MKPRNDDIELIRGVFALTVADRVDDVFELVDPEIEVENVLTGRSLRGGAAARRALVRTLDRGKKWRVTGVDYAPLAGRVLASGRLESESALRGPIELPIAWLFSVKEGKIGRVEMFANERHARQAHDAAGCCGG